MGEQTTHKTCLSTEDVDGTKYWAESNQTFESVGLSYTSSLRSVQSNQLSITDVVPFPHEGQMSASNGRLQGPELRTLLRNWKMGEHTTHKTCLSTEDVDGTKYWAEFNQNWFAKGECRYAFKGFLYGNGPKNDTACVVKVFKETVVKRYSAMVPDLAACKKIAKFLEQFNEMGVSTETINVVFPLIAQLQHADEYTSIEPYLHGTFEKYNTNGGWESQSDPLMTAFSHWTWCASDGQFMACDIQGVKNGNTYTLTDPVIHSVDRIYGKTDLGERGMYMVLNGHTCNAICNKLHLFSPLNSVSFPTRGHHTVFSFQITEEDQLRNMNGI